MKLGIAIAMLLSCVMQIFAQTIVNPLNYGLSVAKTGIERYDVLQKCHQDALRKGAKVSYAGISSIEIDIPEKFSSIPLTSETDFAGCTLKVLNRQKKAVYLFSMIQKTKALVVPAKNIDSADFHSIEELNNGIYLLIVADKKPWVDNRIGYKYGHTRKDVMLVRNGRGSNKPVMPYDNLQSQADCSYCVVDMSQKVVKNLTIVRDARSTAVTNIFRIEAQNNVLLENMNFTTPERTGLLDDRMIRIENCTNVRFENLNVKGTYSASDHSGYAFNLNNIWNHTAHRVKANGNWGVYGNNNIHKAQMEDCDLNRFDIHCYGRDISSKGCVYRSLYNQYSATYGTIRYDDCTFADFIPYLNGGSYNAFVPVDVLFCNCIINLSQSGNKKTCMAKISGLGHEQNKRPELRKKCLPNFLLSNCTINIDKNLKRWYFFNFGNVKEIPSLDNISTINMENVYINGDAAFELANIKLGIDRSIAVHSDRVYHKRNGHKVKFRL